MFAAPVRRGVAVLAAVGLVGGVAASQALAARPGTRADDLIPGIDWVGNGVAVVTNATWNYGFDGQCVDHVEVSTDLVHWRDVVGGLPGPRCLYVWGGASFVSPLDGWMDARNGGSVTTLLAHTLDGGRTWISQPGSDVGSNGGAELFGFSSTWSGWRQEIAVGANGGYLIEHTVDGGYRWSSLETTSPCELLPDVFSTPQLGFEESSLASGVPGPAQTSVSYLPFLLATDDGGLAWHEAVLPRPAPVPKSARALVGEPDFDGDVGTVAVVYLDGHRQVVALDGTEDAGASWFGLVATSLPGQVRASAPGICAHAVTVKGSLVEVAAASPSSWWVLDPPGGPSRPLVIVHLHVVDGAWVRSEVRSSAGSFFSRHGGEGLVRDALQLAPLSTGAALLLATGDQLSPTVVLWRTLDGGATWHRAFAGVETES